MGGIGNTTDSLAYQGLQAKTRQGGASLFLESSILWSLLCEVVFMRLQSLFSVIIFSS